VLAKAGGGCLGIRRPSAAIALDLLAGKSLQSGFATEDSRKDRLQ
jgi:hypothetical protein